IGGDFLPNYSVNAHRYRSPLAAQGVDGFVDNSSSPGSRTQTSYPPASAMSDITPPAARSAVAGHTNGSPAITGPAVPPPRRLQSPPMPGGAAIPASAAHSGYDGCYQHPAHRRAHRRQEHSSRGAHPSLPDGEAEHWAGLGITYVVLPVVTGLIAEAIFD